MSNLEKVDWSKIAKPEDDGAARHLLGQTLQNVALPATDGGVVTMDQLSGLGVVYIYPKTGQPGKPLPDGWNDIPGARGCTPQSCSFRDHFADLQALGVKFVYGISTQTSEAQKEAKTRLHLPFQLLSDEKLEFAMAQNLPQFQVEGMTLLKRMSLIIQDQKIEHVFYPVFPPDQDAENVMGYLKRRGPH